MNEHHQRFLTKFALPDEHYSYEHAPALYLQKSKNVTKEHIDNALSDEEQLVRSTAAGHPNLTKEQLDKALDDSETKVRRRALVNRNLTNSQLMKAADFKDVEERVIVSSIAFSFALFKDSNGYHKITRDGAIKVLKHMNLL